MDSTWDAYRQVDHIFRRGARFVQTHPEYLILYINVASAGMTRFSEQISLEVERYTANHLKTLLRRDMAAGVVRDDLDVNLTAFAINSLYIVFMTSLVSNHFKIRKPFKAVSVVIFCLFVVADRRQLRTIVAGDLRPAPPDRRLAGVHYVAADICGPDMARVFEQFNVDLVVHLAAVVSPGRKSDRRLTYKVDVEGTANVLKACIQCGVRKLIYTSSGAAYGYHPDNPEWLDEADPLRGNPEFAYAHHKRLVEELLADCRTTHPGLEQLIFRPGFILGAATRNQITNLFDQRRITGIKGAASPFVIIWDEDVVGAIRRGIFQGGSGIYNLAGDGVLTLPEMARMLGKPYRALPVWLVAAGLWLGKRLGVTQYGPEQVRFLRYRPVLANHRLKEAFGYIPRKSTREVFAHYLAHRGHDA